MAQFGGRPALQKQQMPTDRVPFRSCRRLTILTQQLESLCPLPLANKQIGLQQAKLPPLPLCTVSLRSGQTLVYFGQGIVKPFNIVEVRGLLICGVKSGSAASAGRQDEQCRRYCEAHGTNFSV